MIKALLHRDGEPHSGSDLSRETPLATVVFSAQGRPTRKNIEWIKEGGFRQIDPKDHQPLDKLYYVHEIRGQITLERRYAVRRELANVPTAALISGVLRPELSDDLEPHLEHFRTRGALPRSGKTFCDAKLPFLVADIEHLDARHFDADFDAREGVQPAHNLLRDVLDFIGADFLICDHLIHASSRFGLIDRHEFRGHVEWLLKEPLTLAQQKRLAHWLNLKCNDKGLPHIFDEGVYDAPRFLFTSRPGFAKKSIRLKRAHYRPLNDAELEELKKSGINIDGERVSLYDSSGQPLLELPEEVAFEISSTTPAVRHSKASRKSNVAESPKVDRRAHGDFGTGHSLRLNLINEINDGRTHAPVRDIIASISNERRDRWPQICERYLKLVIKQIEATSPDAEGRERRINDHARLEAWLQECSKARDKFDATGNGDSRRRLVVDKTQRAQTALPSVPTAREHLNSELKRVVKEAFDYDPEKLVGTGLIQQRERPPFTVFDAAPGLGKSTGMLAAIRPYIRGDKKVIIANPTAKLADDLSPRILSLLEEELLEQGITDPNDLARKAKEQMRVIKGREKLCQDKDGFGVDAAELEKHGISPAPICKVCSKRDTCEYAKQDKTLAPVTVMMHAHLPTTIRKLSKDEHIGLLIVDESILPTLTGVPQSGSYRLLADLEREARRATASRRKSGKKDKAGKQSRIEITADLITSLGRINKILGSTRIAANGVGRISVSALTPLRAIRRTAGAEPHPKRDIDEAISEIQNWEYCAREALEKLIRERADRRAAGEKVRDLSAEIKEIKTTLECAAFYGVILDAFRGSMDNSARTEETDTVMGCWLYDSRGEIHVHAQVHSRLPARLAGVPIIALDGTANEEALHSIAGHSHELRVVKTPVAPPEGSYHLVQYPDSPYGWTKFVDLETGKDRRALLEIWKTICVEAARDYGEATCRRDDGTRIDVLVACQIAVEEALKTIGLPPNVQTIHFNAERGVNAYAGVPSGFVIGRPMLKTPDLEARAEALHYDDHRVKAIHSSGSQKLAPGRRWVDMADGSGIEIPVESHPDPHVNALVRSQVDDEPKQAAHRLRMYSRTAQTPARLFVFGQCDVGLPVHEIRRLADSRCDVADLMLARGVIILSRKYVEIAHKNWIGASDRSERELTDAMRVVEARTNSPSHTAIPIMNHIIASAVCKPNLSGLARLQVKHPSARRLGTVRIDQTRYPDLAKIVAETFGSETVIVNCTLPHAASVSSSSEPAVSLSGVAPLRKRGRPRLANPSRDTAERRRRRTRAATSTGRQPHEVPNKHSSCLNAPLARTKGTRASGPTQTQCRAPETCQPIASDAASPGAPSKAAC